MTSQDFRKQVEGYGLTTANILYRRPDHPWLLQSYVWQNYTTSTQISLNCRVFWSFGRNLSKVFCILSRLRIPTLSNRSRSKQWTAFSGFIDQRPD